MMIMGTATEVLRDSGQPRAGRVGELLHYHDRRSGCPQPAKEPATTCRRSRYRSDSVYRREHASVQDDLTALAGRPRSPLDLRLRSIFHGRLNGRRSRLPGTVSARGCERADAVERIAQPVLLHLQVIAGLQVAPEPLRGAEEPRQPQRRVGADAPLAVHDLVDPPGRDLDLLRQLVLAHRELLEELLQQHLPWMHRPHHRIRCHAPLLASWSPMTATSSGPASGQRKQIRHCWLTRMLYWPARSPASFSSRCPGGTRRSASTSAASSMASLRQAARCSGGSSLRERLRCQTASVSLSPNDRSTRLMITQSVISAPRY